jgi:hypothetical protein
VAKADELAAKARDMAVTKTEVAAFATAAKPHAAIYKRSPCPIGLENNPGHMPGAPLPAGCPSPAARLAARAGELRVRHQRGEQQEIPLFAHFFLLGLLFEGVLELREMPSEKAF